MSNDVLKAKLRTRTGTNAVKKVRNEHFIPGVMYGHHIENVNISIAEKDFERFLKKHGVGASLDLDVDGEKSFVLLKNMDFNSLKNVFYNIEFQALSAGEKIKVKVPVHYLNKDKIPAGLIFQELHHEVEMHVLPKNIIEYIEIDLLNMGHGDSQMLSDLDAYESDKFELLDASDTLMFTITESQVHLEQDPDLETVDAVDIPQIGDDE